VNINKAVKRWIPLALWIAFIFIMSSIPHLPGDYKDLPPGSDKVAHFIEYFVLALLLYRGIREDEVGRTGLILTILVLMGFAVGGLDELYQRNVPGRTSSLMDLTADFSGVLAGALVVYFRWRRSAAGVDSA
jgi:VanZ family protein